MSSLSIRRSPVASALRAARTQVLRIATKPKLIGADCRTSRKAFLSDRGRPTFFGYHDKSPFSADNRKVLATSLKANDADPQAEGLPMEVGYFALEQEGTASEFNRLYTTEAWCWQQGCMLQWHPGNPSEHIVFNALVSGRYGAKVLDITTGALVREYLDPIYALDPHARFAVSLDFARLGRLRPGYGYSTIKRSSGDMPPEDDGLFLLDLRTGQKSLLVSLAELASGCDGDAHYVNHATFSPGGELIAFFHVRSHEGKRKIRLMIVEPTTHRRVVLEENRLVSHYCWRNDDELLATTRDASGLWHYSKYRIDGGISIDLPLNLRRDGHPMFHPTNKDLIVTDTYPDKRRDQHLCIVNIATGMIEEWATLYSPRRYDGQVRCDLHPRWDRLGRHIAVDTTARDRRELAIISIDRASK